MSNKSGLLQTSSMVELYFLLVSPRNSPHSTPKRGFSHHPVSEWPCHRLFTAATGVVCPLSEYYCIHYGEHRPQNTHCNTTECCKSEWASRYSTPWPTPPSTAQPTSLVACIRQPCGAPFTRSLWRPDPWKKQVQRSSKYSIERPEPQVRKRDGN